MLTARQREALVFIEGHQKRTGGVSPSFVEICAHLGMASKSSVARLLDGLEERGFIRRLPHKSRAIEVLKSAPEPVAEVAS